MASSLFDPSTHPSLSTNEAELIKHISNFTREFFQNPKFDPSHDFNHVMRVVSNTIHILDQELNYPSANGQEAVNYDAFTVIAGALLHDVDDVKYVEASSNGIPIAKQELLRLNLHESDAERVQTLVEGVSYSSEKKDPERTKALIEQIPELAIVQDADRLDAIGAIGIARCFTYGGAKQARTLELSVKHFTDKLVKLESMMKTATGKKLAAERTRRILEYLDWWQDETNFYSH